MRLQDAMEFMITYGWAILILAIALVTLYSLGVFKAGSTAPNICALPADVGCVNEALFPTGLLIINIQQATPYTINVVAIGCNDKGLTNNALIPLNVISPPVTISIGGNYTFNNIQCYSNYLPYGAPIGSTYTGYIIVNYTDLSTGFQHTAQGSLIQQVK